MKYIDYKLNLLNNLYSNLLLYSGAKKENNYKKANHVRGAAKINFKDSLDYTKEQISQIDKDAEILKKLNEAQNNSEIIKLLESEYEKYEKIMELRDEEFDNIVETFDEETKKAFLILKDGHSQIFLGYDEGRVCINVEETGSYSVNLVFETLENVEQDNICDVDILISDIELVRKDSEYVLGIIYNDFSNDQEVAKEFSFANVSVKVDLFDYVSNEMFFCNNAWEILADILNELEIKADWGKQYLNEKERELFPLTGFAPIISFLQWKSDRLNYQVSNEQYELMKGYIEKSACTYLMPLLEDLYREKDDKKIKKLCDKFNNQLRKMEAKQLWHCIREDLLEASSGYISKIQFYASDEKVDFIRNCIDEEMRLNKIEGTYPYYYVKHNENGKNIISHIKCDEDASKSNYITVEIHIGVSIEKEDDYNENFTGFYDVFYAKNYVDKKDAKVDIYHMDVIFNDEEDYSSKDIRKQIEKYCITAAKLAYGRKIEKSEKAYVQGTELSKTATILFAAVVGILAGLVFSSLLCLGLAIISVLITLVVTGSFSEVADILLDKIWLYEWLGSWGVFSAIIFILFLVNAIKDKLFRK